MSPAQTVAYRVSSVRREIAEVRGELQILREVESGLDELLNRLGRVSDKVAVLVAIRRAVRNEVIRKTENGQLELGPNLRTGPARRGDGHR